jgi:hypothetical protein
MFGRWDEQAFQPAAQVGRAADVGLGVGGLAVEREDGALARKLLERRARVGGIEGNGLELDRQKLLPLRPWLIRITRIPESNPPSRWTE